MEEFVGEVWHRLVTRQAQTGFPAARVALDSVARQLAPYYRALGGAAGKVIEGAQPRAFNTRRPLIQRVAGTHRHFAVSWQDDRSVRLPNAISCFPEARLNESLYFWLAALAAQQPVIRHWFADNQCATRALLEARPGLRRVYAELVEALLALRSPLAQLQGAELERERAIRQALSCPGRVAQLPLAAGDPQPVPLWFYPAPLQVVSVAGDDPIETGSPPSPELSEVTSERKQATRIDDSKSTDGLLVFQLESLFSWAEQVQLDRCQEENQEDDIASAAEDLDVITLSRQRRAGAAKIRFDLDLPAAESDELPLGEGLRLPEWDCRKSVLVPDFCLLQPMLADDAKSAAVPAPLQATARLLKRRFAAMRTQRRWQLRQPSGEELDLDAWLDHASQPMGTQSRQDFYKARHVDNRELSCLLLADLSMSTDSALSADKRVIDVIRETLLLFAEALSGSGDPFAIYGFSSVKNKQVRYHLLKNFAETYSDQARGRILAIKPGFYTRMGAAIRQSTDILKRQSSEKRLLLIISDGKPNDIDQYEGRYGIEDTRQAIVEAKRLGLRPFCVTIDDKGNDYLPYLFGDQGYAVVSDIERLPRLLPKLYLNLTGYNT